MQELDVVFEYKLRNVRKEYSHTNKNKFSSETYLKPIMRSVCEEAT